MHYPAELLNKIIELTPNGGNAGTTVIFQYLKPELAAHIAKRRRDAKAAPHFDPDAKPLSSHHIHTPVKNLIRPLK